MNSSGIARPARVCVCVCVAAVCWAVAGCDKNNGGATPAADAGHAAVAEPEAPRDAGAATPGPTASATDGGVNAGANAATDAGAAAAGPAVLTVRLLNAGDRPMNVAMIDDLNEMLHVRRLNEQQRHGGGNEDGERVKLFPVGRMALCSQAQGAGYGGIGTAGRHTLQPGEAMEFAWDGRQRAEVLQPGRGVCQDMSTPQPGRYRFEFDQPYDTPRCNQPTFDWPLADGAPRAIEIRCVARAVTHHG